jgi:hypothetical protein
VQITNYCNLKPEMAPDYKLDQKFDTRNKFFPYFVAVMQNTSPLRISLTYFFHIFGFREATNENKDGTWNLFTCGALLILRTQTKSNDEVNDSSNIMNYTLITKSIKINTLAPMSVQTNKFRKRTRKFYFATTAIKPPSATMFSHRSSERLTFVCSNNLNSPF